MKLSWYHIGHNRLFHGHLMTKTDQQPTCTNSACGNQKLSIKYCILECPYGVKTGKNNIQSSIKTLLGKVFKVSQGNGDMRKYNN